jgi:hypothetical protein
VPCRKQGELDAWAADAGYRSTVVAPLGLILKADGVSWANADERVLDRKRRRRLLGKQEELLKPRFTMASVAMMLPCVRRLGAASRPGARIVMIRPSVIRYREDQLQLVPD